MSTFNIAVERRLLFPVFAAPRRWDRMCPMCGLRWRSALLIPRLLGCFLLQSHHISFLLPYPVREGNTPIWPLLASLRYKYKIKRDLIFHLLSYPACWRRPSLLTETQLQAALTCRAQKSTFGVDIAGDGALWWRLMKKVMSWVWIAWFASEMTCIQVLNATQKCQERKDFQRAFLGALKNVNMCLESGGLPLSPLMWSTPFLWGRQSYCSSA